VVILQRPLLHSAWRLLLAAGFIGGGLAAIHGCTFPNFIALPNQEGGAGGMGGAEPNAGSGATSSGGQGAAGTGGTGNAQGGMDSAGEGGNDEGGAPPVEVGPCGERPHPLHCRNHVLDADETDVDCGGSACPSCGADEVCEQDSDCAVSACEAGQCARTVAVRFHAQLPDLETTTFRARIEVSYLGAQAMLLRDVTVRYYFSRNSVMEPLLPSFNGTQLPSGGDIAGNATTSIVRQLRGDGITNDAYVEIGFTGGRVLNPGDTLDLVASVTTGNSSTSFNQGTHHSWDNQVALHESKKVSVHIKGERVWGRGPEIDDPPSCFFEGVNLDGPVVQIDGEPWLGSPASLLARYQNPVVPLFPATDAGREEMLRSGFLLQNDSFTYPVMNGTYALLVYVWSADGGEQGALVLDGVERDQFQATSYQGGGPWVALGPYRITIDDGAIEIGATGSLRVGGLELRLLDE
jgi:hypothetical protein